MHSGATFDDAVRRHDARIGALGLDVWVGSEPTFTDRFAQTPEWLNQPLGGDKEQRAEALLAGLGRWAPGAAILRSVGRQYPGEELPRWSLGLYERRDGRPVWQGPPDPLLVEAGEPLEPDLDVWVATLADNFWRSGWRVWPVRGASASERRLLVCFAADAEAPDLADPRLERPSIHGRTIPESGLRDELAEAGAHLFLLRAECLDGAPVACLELPSLPDVARFLEVLDGVALAASALGLTGLMLTGYPPPVDASVAWTTLTPDPAVVEVNAAPSADASEFLLRCRRIYATATEQELAPYRLYYNGVVADSGGGGQITLGGPSPTASPFIRQPEVLPRLVRFFNQHPALSYLFAHDYVGSGGQSVRSDERGADAYYELALTLALLQRAGPLTPDLVWRSLTHFLCDAAGNSHRAEINIEKLWNPHLPGRGQLGLVEFRALRMQRTPERATALACLLRALVAMLSVRDEQPLLRDWGRDLHERFALPFYLEQDLRAVLEILAEAGLDLDAPIRDQLMADEFRLWGRAELPGCVLEVRRGVEFWPLLGDAASPEQGGGYRMVDASTARLELRLLPAGTDAADWADWRVLVQGVPLPMRLERDVQGPARVFGLRYRNFVPYWGLHPALPAQGPLSLVLGHPRHGGAYRVTLHEWRPNGEAYPGLPADLEEAACRRAERITTVTFPAEGPLERAGNESDPVPAPGLGPYSLDLRYPSA